MSKLTNLVEAAVGARSCQGDLNQPTDQGTQQQPRNHNYCPIAPNELSGVIERSIAVCLDRPALQIAQDIFRELID